MVTATSSPIINVSPNLRVRISIVATLRMTDVDALLESLVCRPSCSTQPSHHAFRHGPSRAGYQLIRNQCPPTQPLPAVCCRERRFTIRFPAGGGTVLLLRVGVADCKEGRRAYCYAALRSSFGGQHDRAHHTVGHRLPQV